MKVFDLGCGHGHRFEGWFASEADYLAQRERGLVSCPACDDHAVERLPSAPRLNVATRRGDRTPPAPDGAATAGADGGDPARTHAEGSRGAPPDAPGPGPDSPPPGPGDAGAPGAPDAVQRLQAVQALAMRAMRDLLARTEDVGRRFPEEARRIHYGESPERAIRGEASPEDAQSLRDEGIGVVALPLPAALKNRLQ